MLKYLDIWMDMLYTCYDLTVWIFCPDGRVCLQRLWLSLVVDGFDPELVVVAVLEALDVALLLVGVSVGDGDPSGKGKY